MSTRRHVVQLRICHQPIGGHGTYQTMTPEKHWPCSLETQTWCWTCEYYVCDIHAKAKHSGHDLDDENSGSPLLVAG